jgi:D-alanyl-D-alanine carboxypeptidase
MSRVHQGSAQTPDARVTLDQALAADTETPGPAGTAQSYSNVSFVLLARLVEAVTHRSYASALHDDLLAPAGLTRVAVQDADKPIPPLAYPVDPAHRAPVADGYLPDRYTASAAVGAGSIAASAQDEALWGYDLYTGRVLPTSLTSAMMTPQRTGALSYGLGTVVSDPSRLGLEAPAVGHEGEVVHHRADGTDDGYRSVLLVVPSKHVSVAVTIDDSTDSAVGIALALIRLVTS